MSRGPRRLVLDGLATPLARLRWLKEHWTVGAHVYDPPAEPGGNAVRRRRRPDEYPEAAVASWDAVVGQVDAAIAELVELRAYAAAQRMTVGTLADPARLARGAAQ